MQWEFKYISCYHLSNAFPPFFPPLYLHTPHKTRLSQIFTNLSNIPLPSHSFPLQTPYLSIFQIPVSSPPDKIHTTYPTHHLYCIASQPFISSLLYPIKIFLNIILIRIIKLIHSFHHTPDIIRDTNRLKFNIFTQSQYPGSRNIFLSPRTSR